MTHEACESKLRSVVRSSKHPHPGNCVAIRHAVVYYAWAAREFSAGIKCRHCWLVKANKSKHVMQIISLEDYHILTHGCFILNHHLFVKQF